ncbi:MAG TPA: hypothetical protein VJL81_15125 [Solirubrobacterales bacterium]|nr:hypothetical protein [Solirubrobacterales bacterium]
MSPQPRKSAGQTGAKRAKNAVRKEAKKLGPELTKSNQRAGYLLSGLTVLTFLFTTLGIQSSELSDLWRDQQILSLIAVTLVLSAVTLGALAGWVFSRQKSEHRLLLWGNICLGLGLVVIACSVIHNASSSPPPTVTAAPAVQKGSTVVKATVEDDKLTSGQSIQVKVQPLYEEGKGRYFHYNSGRAIYSAIFGPDSDGTVHRSIRVAIPPGNFEDIGVRASTGSSASDCFDTAARNGCVVVRVPPHSDPPQLSFGWKRDRLRVHLTAFDVPSGEVQILARSLSPPRLLLHTAVSTNLSDDVRRTFSLPIAGLRYVCVVASESAGKLACHHRKGGSTGWAVLRVPGSDGDRRGPG